MAGTFNFSLPATKLGENVAGNEEAWPISHRKLSAGVSFLGHSIFVWLLAAVMSVSVATSCADTVPPTINVLKGEVNVIGGMPVRIDNTKLVL